jgi:hypothetical protein
MEGCLRFVYRHILEISSKLAKILSPLEQCWLVMVWCDGCSHWFLLDFYVPSNITSLKNEIKSIAKT